MQCSFLLQFTFTNSEWVEASFQKRECGKIIPSAKYGNRYVPIAQTLSGSVPKHVDHRKFPNVIHALRSVKIREISTNIKNVN